MRTPSREEIAWAAGWFEGEGSIPRFRGKPCAAKVSVTNTDYDVLISFQGIFDVGLIYPIFSGQTPLKQRWIFQAHGEDAIFILTLMYPWLHARRRARADELFSARAEKLGPKECRYCGVVFTPERVTGTERIYCSSECRRLNRSRPARVEVLA